MMDQDNVCDIGLSIKVKQCFGQSYNHALIYSVLSQSGKENLEMGG